MITRELHDIDCIEIPINGAGDYFFPQTSFSDKKIDSIFIWDQKFIQGGNDNMLNENLFLSVYSIEAKPLYINVPCSEFRFDNLNYHIAEVIDFNLLKITYTGNETFNLLCYFSKDEKIINYEAKADKNKTIIRGEFRQITEDVSFTANEIDFFKNKKIQRIYYQDMPFFFDIVFVNGKSLKNIPSIWFDLNKDNIIPFCLNDEIDFERSKINLDVAMYFNLTFFYK